MTYCTGGLLTAWSALICPWTEVLLYLTPASMPKFRLPSYGALAKISFWIWATAHTGQRQQVRQSSQEFPSSMPRTIRALVRMHGPHTQAPAQP
jgi:hypothetical protein